MKLLFTLLLSFAILPLPRLYASPPDSLPTAHFYTTQTASETQFSATLTPLRGMVGGRSPFYTYLWDFGDGHFSFQKNPIHHYTKSGIYNALLYVVNNYDDGPRPGRGSKKVYIASAYTAPSEASPAETDFFSSNGVFQLGKNTNALPGQDMTVIVGVKYKGKGRIFLLTNEKSYGMKGLTYIDQSTYNNEKLLPPPDLRNLQGMWASVHKATLTYSGSPDYGIKKEFKFNPDKAIKYFSRLYKSYKTISNYEINDSTGKAQFTFINLRATPEMWEDTNAIITITGVFIPEDSGEAIIHKMEVPIVASHDPNKMAMRHARTNYRLLHKKKKLTYKVQFQNNGKGDAKDIWLEMALPKQTDPATFHLLSLYPYCDSCKSKSDKGCWELIPKGEDTLVFHFKEISLPGSKAKDIMNRDSTKGFIRFNIKTKKKLVNKPFPSSTRIIFDKNEPITTNMATGRFRWGLSPIIFAGYSAFMPQLGNEGMTYKEKGMLGLGIAPIAPYKKLYFQFEVYGNLVSYKQQMRVDSSGVISVPNTANSGIRNIEYKYYQRKMEAEDLKIRIVPLHLRYNFTNFISAGVGLLTAVNINLNSKEDRTYIPFENRPMPSIEKSYDSWQGGARGKDFEMSSFLDLNVGNVYLGPSLGLRYYFWGADHQQINIYIAWRI